VFQPNGISLHVEDHGRQAGGLATRMLAFVALRDGCVTNEDELREHARRRLADFEVAGQNCVFGETARKV